MALDKNKEGIMAAISAASVGKAPVAGRAHRSLPKGTVGSVRAGIGGIQEIDPEKIQSWGPKDRMVLTAVNSGPGMEDFDDLLTSIRESGQQVPVLLRPAPSRDGYFDVVYGRRRILACREMGIPVKALIRTLDDTEALVAKGLENSSRTDLSFYERARFAEAILAQGYSREDARRALSISKNSLSQLERVTRCVPGEVGDCIGAAPAAGRPKWMTLSAAFEGNALTPEDVFAIVQAQPEDTSSDARLDAVIAALSKRGTKEHRATERTPLSGVTIKSGKAGMSLTVKRTKETAGFSDWLEANIDRLIMESYQNYKEADSGR